MSISVFVAGHPAMQGSKKHVGGGVMVEMCKRLPGWRTAVRVALIRELGLPIHPIEGAVQAEVEFILPRPKSCPKKRTPPAIKQNSDLDKLQRALFDSITLAGAWRDDSQVVKVSAVKRIAEIGETPGCHLTIGAA